MGSEFEKDINDSIVGADVLASFGFTAKELSNAMTGSWYKGYGESKCEYCDCEYEGNEKYCQ